MSTFIVGVVENIFKEEIKKCDIQNWKIMSAIFDLFSSYSFKGRMKADAINFDLSAHRCAYLYQYAMCHSSIVLESLSQFRAEHSVFFHDWVAILMQKLSLNILSVGGGPGSDIIGLLLFIRHNTSLPSEPFFHCNIDVFDAYKGWEQNFSCALEALHFWDMFSSVNASYNNEDLLKGCSRLLENKIKDADILTMVKFVSAIAADEESTALLLQRIFHWMKPGSLLLFIDNYDGYALEFMNRIIQSCGMNIVYGPLHQMTPSLVHNWHSVSFFSNYIEQLDGWKPKTKGKFTVAIWEKPQEPKYSGLKRSSSWATPTPPRKIQRFSLEAFEHHKLYACSQEQSYSEFNSFSPAETTHFRNFHIDEPAINFTRRSKLFGSPIPHHGYQCPPILLDSCDSPPSFLNESFNCSSLKSPLIQSTHYSPYPQFGLGNSQRYADENTYPYTKHIASTPNFYNENKINDCFFSPRNKSQSMENAYSFNIASPLAHKNYINSYDESFMFSATPPARCIRKVRPYMIRRPSRNPLQPIQMY